MTVEQSLAIALSNSVVFIDLSPVLKELSYSWLQGPRELGHGI